MMIQYIKKPTKSRSGKKVFRRDKIGVMVANVRKASDAFEKDRIQIGFSLKHRKDRYDWVDGEHKPNHGRNMAYLRAERWADRHISEVNVPDSIIPDVSKFAVRCMKYFKDAELPDWVKVIATEYNLKNPPKATKE